MDRWYRTNRYLCASCLFVSFTVSLRMILMPTAGASRVRFKQMLRSRRVRAILYLCSCSCSHTRTRVCVGTHARTPTPISTCTPFSTRTPILYLSREKGSQEVTTDFAEVGGVVRHAGIKGDLFLTRCLHHRDQRRSVPYQMLASLELGCTWRAWA